MVKQFIKENFLVAIISVKKKKMLLLKGVYVTLLDRLLPGIKNDGDEV